MNQIDLALSRFAEGFNCSQAVFSSYAEGIDEATALKIASGFGGGMGRMAETCGAVTGAMMVLGLKFGGHARSRGEGTSLRKGQGVCRPLQGQERFASVPRPVGLRHQHARRLRSCQGEEACYNDVSKVRAGRRRDSGRNAINQTGVSHAPHDAQVRHRAVS